MSDIMIMERAIELVSDGMYLPAFVQHELSPMWGHWDTHRDFLTGYAHRAAPKPVQKGHYMAWIAQVATMTCPSGPCGYERVVEVAVTMEEFRRTLLVKYEDVLAEFDYKRYVGSNEYFTDLFLQEIEQRGGPRRMYIPVDEFLRLLD